MSGTRLSMLLRVPPIAYFAIVFAAGFVLEALAFGAPHPPMPDSLPFWIGLALLLPAGYFGFGAWRMFRIRRLELMPGEPVATMVTDGPFAFSRNPMYLGLALLHAGLCLILGLPVTLVLLAVPLLVMQFVVIPCEEKRMTETFGEAFAHYRRRVRRWLEAASSTRPADSGSSAPAPCRRQKNRDRGPGSCT
jgi:protein-S-isoprenylcysteine O-methyltransferase Ste14